METFRDTLEDCELHDLGFAGQWFTWERGRLVENNIREWLDRGMANSDWWNKFPRYTMKNLPYSISYHCPILMETMGSPGARRHEFPFRFNAEWILQPNFEDHLKVTWNSHDGDIPERLEALGVSL